MKALIPYFPKEKLVIFTTLLFAFVGLGLPKFLVEPHLGVFGFSLVLAGVPHGASDFYLSRELSQGNERKFSSIWFLMGYFLIMASYSLVWWIAPQVAFWMFVLISAYHFGQSNWSFLKFPGMVVQKMTFLLWGMSVIGVPVILHFEQASNIILEMTGVQMMISDSNRAALIFLLIFGVVGNLLHLNSSGTLSSELLKIELGKFLLLLFLFFTTPLLVGFGVYFVLWHSLTAIYDQVKVVKASNTSFGYKSYIRSIIPLTLVAYAGLGLSYYFFNGFFDKGQSLGLLFIFIAVITVPHVVLMEWLYHVGSHVLEKSPPIGLSEN